jgi:hypothetical protein
LERFGEYDFCSSKDGLVLAVEYEWQVEIGFFCWDLGKGFQTRLCVYLYKCFFSVGKNKAFIFDEMCLVVFDQSDII